MDKSLRTLLDIETDQIIWCDVDGKILFLNSSAAHGFGKPIVELINFSIWDFYPESKKPHHQILMHQVIKNGQPVTVKNKIHDSWLETILFPIHGAHEKVESVVFIARDISPFVESETRLNQVRMQLINVQEEERYRISRDLHDEIGQRMTSLILQLRAVKDLVETEKKITIDEISNSIRDLETINKQVRQVFYQLYPPSLNRMALPKVLQAFCTSIGEENNLMVDFNCQEGLPELQENHNLVIYRFFQEGLNNVIKHAKSTAVWINLDYSDDRIYFSLEDDGSGFDQDRIKYGVGLTGISERLISLNGKLKIESAPEKGTRLSGVLPVIMEAGKI